jgi:hypothetical protein
MSFLDNSGDIILDAVITDAGRKRMAEGKFNITKYAFSDEEINYALFNSAHPSGSAFYDLQIMQTPIFEAFTNNTSTMSSKLMTLNDNNYLYLPVLKLNELWGTPQLEAADSELKAWSSRVIGTAIDKESGAVSPDSTLLAGDPAADNAADHAGMFVVTCDSSTERLWQWDSQGAEVFSTHAEHYSEGVIFGASDQIYQDASFICVDQGISGASEGLNILTPFPAELRETAYLVRMDHRLGRLASAPQGIVEISQPDGQGHAPVSRSRGRELITNFQEGAPAGAIPSRRIQPYAFVDDDHIATYYITNNSDLFEASILNSIRGIPNRAYLEADAHATANLNGALTKRWLGRQAFQSGPVGSRLQFTVRAQDTVRLSYDLFDTTQTKKLHRDHKFADPDDLPANTTWFYTSGDISVNYIDSVITVTGVTTGYTLNIPVRYVKKSA